MAMTIGRNVGRYVSARSFAAGNGAAFTRRETAIAPLAARSYCTSRNVGRYVSARSSAAGKGAAFPRRETAIASPAARSYCTRSTPPTGYKYWIMEKGIGFVMGIGVPFILPTTIIYWWDGMTEDAFWHRKVAELKERLRRLIRNPERNEGDN